MPDRGCFYPPTLITGLSPADPLMQDEIFGPVLVGCTFRTPEEAVALANNSRYGLAATVWSENVNLALDIAPKLVAGIVWINGTNMMDAAVSLHELTGEVIYLDSAETWATCLDENFRDMTDGAFFTTALDNLDLIANQKTASDNAVPAGNGILLGVFTKLYLITGKEIYQTRAEEIIHNFSGEIDRNFYPLSSFLNNTEFFLKPLQIIIIGEGEEAEALRQSVNKTALADHL